MISRSMSKIKKLEVDLKEVLAIAFTDKDIDTRGRMLILITEFFKNPSNVRSARASTPIQRWSLEEINKRKEKIIELASPIIKQILLSLTSTNIEQKLNMQVINNLKHQLITTNQENSPLRNNIKVIVLGFEGSGKSTLIEVMKGSTNPIYRKTTGFHPKRIKLRGQTVMFYDLGGCKEMQKLWKRYFYDVHGIIFTVDVSAPVENLMKSFEAFETILSHEYMYDKPALLFLNKFDLIDDSKETPRIPSQFSNRHIEYTWGSLISCMKGGILDSRIFSSIFRLIDTINNQFNTLETRITTNTAQELEKQVTEKRTKELGILRQSVTSKISMINQEDSQYLRREIGEEFLRNEIGRETLCEDAKICASMVKYHKPSLLILGNMILPVRKMAKKYNWSEVLNILKTIEEEDDF